MTDAGATALLGIYGAGGCGRGVMPVADAMLAATRSAGSYELVFVDDASTQDTVNGRRVMTFEAFVAAPAAERALSLAVANAQTRRRLDTRCGDAGIGFFDIVAAQALRLDDVTLGVGAIVAPFVTLTSNIRIGRHFHANLYAYVEHDCVIGDFVTFAPSVRCNGNVRIEDDAYLGAGCILRQGDGERPLVIGRGAVVGMGAVVTKDVPPGATVVGNPARVMTENGS